jgi:predicted protein tyrosine phosphatase
MLLYLPMNNTDFASSSLNSTRTAGPRSRGAWWKLLLVVLLLPALYFGADRLWSRVIRDYFYPRNFGVVEPGRIFRSGLISHHIIQKTLTDNRVALVLSMSGDDSKSHDADFERAACEQLHIRRLIYHLNGNGTGDPSNYINALAELADADHKNLPVLIHCKTGAQRTGAMVVYYRVLIQGRSGKQAYAELLQYGHEPQKNPLLAPYLNQHMRKIAQGLVDKGVIKQVPDPLPVIEP